MPETLLVTCVELSYPGAKEFTSIEKIGWENTRYKASGKSSPAEMYDMIDRGEVVAVIPNGKHELIKLMPIMRDGKKFVKTEPNDQISDNLLSLPNCP